MKDYQSLVDSRDSLPKSGSGFNTRVHRYTSGQMVFVKFVMIPRPARYFGNFERSTLLLRLVVLVSKGIGLQ